MKDVKTVFDSLEYRCPQLGGQVPFDYCRKVNDGLPCARSLICWEAAFPVGEYMKRVLSEEEWRLVFETPGKTRLEKVLLAADKSGDPNRTGS